MLDLAPGAYTIVVSGVNGQTGVGLVGVYEVDNAQTPLVNISARGMALTGNDVMILGFIVQGAGPQTVAVVATGPSLSAYGIASPLGDPTLTLVRIPDQVVIATNDDWQAAGNVAAIGAAGLAPAYPRESAILLTLEPGAYTAIVSDADGGSGVAVVAVYAVP